MQKKWKCDAKFLWKNTQKITLNLSFIPRCRGCNFCEQADGIIARQAPRLTMNFWLTGLVWVWNESAIKINLNQNYFLVQLIVHPILWIPNFNFPNLKCCKVFFLFNITRYWHFWVYFDINIKLLSGKNTQKVNKKNIQDS